MRPKTGISASLSASTSARNFVAEVSGLRHKQ